MSYCVAYKRNNTVYLYADTAVSSHKEPYIKYNSFGQIQTEHEGFYVEEALLKIVKIRDNFVIAYASDDVKASVEMIETIERYYDDVGLKGILSLLESSYGNISSTELILVYSNSQTNPEIYTFTSGKCIKSEWAEIGSGKNIKNLSRNVKTILDNIHGNDDSKFLSISIAALQCYVFHNNLFEVGIGGIFTGVYVKQKVHYPKSLDCYIFEDDINKCTSMITSLCMEELFFSSANVVRGYMLPGMKLDDRLVRKVRKAIDTKAPFYFCIYSNFNNQMLFMEINGRVHNGIISRYVKRGVNKTDYMFSFNSIVLDDLEFFSDNYKNDETPFIQEVSGLEGYNHDVFMEWLKENDSDRWEILNSFDYDFEYMEPKIDKSLLKKIKKNINYYNYLVLIDYEYFYSSLKEFYELWSETNSFKGDIHEMDFRNFFLIVYKNTIAEEMDFDELGIIFVKKPSKEHHFIQDFDFDEYINNFKNVFVVADNNEFYVYCYSFLKNYYLNDDFFALEKFIIVFDDEKTDEVLYNFAPKFNYDYGNRKFWETDIVVVRNEDALTKVQTSFPHAIMQFCLFYMFTEDFNEWYAVDIEVYDILVDRKEKSDVS
ncbi:MAG: hypothetical protein IKW81_14165 [Pseudobutyrivibrio sp.]|nr:hypothetical protein [Pseudobutyrivibrio sp.]